MDLSRLTVHDFFGRDFLRLGEKGRFEGYYFSLEALRDLVTSQKWRRSVSGFYINVAGDYDAVRLSYFTPDPDDTRSVLDQFLKTHRITSIQDPEGPMQTEISQDYGGEELRFRRFLSTYTPIGLDIMKEDLLNARCLFATFRWQVMRARLPYVPHFVKTFERHSPFYAALSPADKEQFWQDLAHWPNPRQADWAHMFVNMVLGCDWIRSWDLFLQPHPPLSIQEINQRTSPSGFQVPPHWQA